MICCVFIVLVKFCFVLTDSAFIGKCIFKRSKPFLKNFFLSEPKESIDSQEIFQYRTHDEFIINNYAVTWNQANYICTHTLNGFLAYFESQDVVDFVAEYLGDSDMSLNTLWVNLRKQSFDEEWKTWSEKTVNESIFECPHHNSSDLCPDCTKRRRCGAIVRMFHTKVCFVKLQCRARRKFICRRCEYS